MGIPRRRALQKLLLLVVGVAALIIGGVLPGSYVTGTSTGRAYRAYDLDAYSAKDSCDAVAWLGSTASWSYRVGLVSAAVLVLVTVVMAVSRRAQQAVWRLVRFAKVVSGVLTAVSFITLMLLFFIRFCGPFPREGAGHPGFTVLLLPVYCLFLVLGHYVAREVPVDDGVSEAGTEHLVPTPPGSPSSSPKSAKSLRSVRSAGGAPGTGGRSHRTGRPRGRSRSRSGARRRHSAPPVAGLARRSDDGGGAGGVPLHSSPGMSADSAPHSPESDIRAPDFEAAEAEVEALAGSPLRVSTPYRAVEDAEVPARPTTP